MGTTSSKNIQENIGDEKDINVSSLRNIRKTQHEKLAYKIALLCKKRAEKGKDYCKYYCRYIDYKCLNILREKYKFRVDVKRYPGEARHRYTIRWH